MQLFSVDQQRSQALEAHAAAFASFKVRLFLALSLSNCTVFITFVIFPLKQVPGNENPSTLITFVTKTLNAGQVTSKLHVIELGAQPGDISLLLLECSHVFTHLHGEGFSDSDM